MAQLPYLSLAIDNVTSELEGLKAKVENQNRQAIANPAPTISNQDITSELYECEKRSHVMFFNLADKDKDRVEVQKLISKATSEPITIKN